VALTFALVALVLVELETFSAISNFSCFLKISSMGFQQFG
jgi:hypothetical protein